MKIFFYYFQSAFKNIWREKWINLLTILSISIGLLILCAFALLSLNMDSVLRHWSKGFGIVVYLDEAISKQEEKDIENQFLNDPDIIKVNYISKEQALIDVRDTLGTDAVILDNIKENPLPSSFEIKLKNDLLNASYVKDKSSELRKMKSISEVQYGEQWLSSLNTISETMMTGAAILGFAIFIAVTFITYSTIKIFFYRRKDEVETLKLLGATKSFIRVPFLVEGLFIGVMGGILSSLTVFSAHSFATLRIAEFMPSIRSSLAILPYSAYIAIPVAGALMSLIGSYIAVGKIRY